MGSIFKTVEARAEFADWYVEQEGLARAERGEQEETWKKWRRQREAKPEKKERNHPWPKSANLSPPLSLITGQTMFGQLHGAFGYVKPLLVTKALNTTDKDQVRRMKALTKYIGILSDNPFEIDLPRRNRTILLETGTIGTEWVKVYWDDTPWNFVKADGTTVRGKRIHHGVSVLPIPIEDVLHRQTIQDPMKMAWISHRFLMPKWEFLDLKRDGILSDPEDEVEGFEKDVRPEAQRDQQSRMGIAGADETENLEMHEVYARWDANEDGRTEEVIALVHPDTGVVLQEAWNPIGLKLLIPSQYMERPYFLEGIGTCWMTESSQDEVETTHNIRVNSMHLTTMPIFVGKQQSNLKEGETFYPGKLLLTTGGPNDVAQLTTNVAIQWSERSEAIAKEYAQRATGMSDIMQGMADTTARTGDTLGGQTQRLQQGTRLVNSVISGLKDFYRQMGMLIVFHLVDHREDVLKKEGAIGRLSAEELQDVGDVLNMPVEAIPTMMSFDVRAADVEETVQQKRQDLLFRVQIQNLFYDRMMSVVMQMGNPQIPQEAKVFMTQVYTASARTLEKVLGFFEEEEPDKYVPEYKRLEMYNEIVQLMMDKRYEMMLQGMGGMPGGGMNGRGQAAQAQIPAATPAGGPGGPGGAGGAGEGEAPEGLPEGPGINAGMEGSGGQVY